MCARAWQLYCVACQAQLVSPLLSPPQRTAHDSRGATIATDLGYLQLGYPRSYWLAACRPCARCAYAIPAIARRALCEDPSYPPDTPALLLHGRRATRGPSYPRNRWSAPRSCAFGTLATDLRSSPDLRSVGSSYPEDTPIVSQSLRDREPHDPPSVPSGCVLQGSTTLEDSAQ